MNSDLTQQLRQVSLIIWDEIVMCHRYCLEAVNRTLRDITGISLSFGGKCVLLCGDFLQILPVIPGGSRAQILNACLRSSHLYSQVKTLRLSENMRLNALQQNPNADAAALQFPFYLLQVEKGLVADIENDRVFFPESITTCTDDISTVCNRVFEGMAERHTDDEWLMGRAVLTIKNVHLQEINTIAGAMIPGTTREYRSANKVENEDEKELRYPVEMLNRLIAVSALPDHRLVLKKGYSVMLLRNIDPNNGHCDGARYIVKDMTDNLLFLRFAIWFNSGSRLTLPRIPCGPGDDNFLVPGFTRTQVPVRVYLDLQQTKRRNKHSAVAWD